MKKVNLYNIGGVKVKEDERYIVKDNTFGNKLILSSTNLKPNKETSGHYHNGQEEVYFFINGHGKMTIDKETFDVKENDIICINDGEFHKVHNTSNNNLYFVCVFNGEREGDNNESN